MVRPSSFDIFEHADEDDREEYVGMFLIDDFEPFDDDEDGDGDEYEVAFVDANDYGDDDDFPMYLEYEGPFGLSGYDEY